MEIGNKIKKLRNQNNLTQEELANRCELSKGFISQVERDLTSPSIATLVDILDALGTNLTEFFSEERDEKVVFTREDFFELENEELKHTINWIIPNAQKNSMEPILLEIEPRGRTKLDLPHNGEEFGFVLSGTINLHLGKKIYQVKKGESFYYEVKESHFIENPFSTRARVIWISTPPNF